MAHIIKDIPPSPDWKCSSFSFLFQKKKNEKMTKLVQLFHSLTNDEEWINDEDDWSLSFSSKRTRMGWWQRWLTFSIPSPREPKWNNDEDDSTIPFCSIHPTKKGRRMRWWERWFKFSILLLQSNPAKNEIMTEMTQLFHCASQMI